MGGCDNVSFVAPNSVFNRLINYESKVISCNLSTAKKNAVAIGLDAAGFIPGEKLLGAVPRQIAIWAQNGSDV
jgi:hypothetical protein